MSEKKLEGQVAWISGAASGMGAAIAVRFAAAGAKVLAVDVQVACEDSPGITGAPLVVDGGWTVCAEWETAGPTRFATAGS